MSNKYGDAAAFKENKHYHFEKKATDLGIDIKKKKKDDLICDILVNSTSIDSLCHIDEVFSSIDPTLTQFKENLPSFNKATYQLLGP